MRPRLVRAVLLVVGAFVLNAPSSAWAQVVLPTTPCDSVVSHSILGFVMTQEDGTISFRYGPDNQTFVSVGGSTLSINVNLLFAPDDEQDSVKFMAYDVNCQPLYGQAYGHGAGWLLPLATNTLAYDTSTFQLSINGNPDSTVNVSNGPQVRYIAIEVFDFSGYPVINNATYSYLIDVQNPQNPSIPSDCTNPLVTISDPAFLKIRSAIPFFVTIPAMPLGRSVFRPQAMSSSR